MKHIVSRDNAHFRELKKLCRSGREQKKSGRIVLDGLHLIESYTERFGWPDEIIVSETGAGRAEIIRCLESLETIPARVGNETRRAPQAADTVVQQEKAPEIAVSMRTGIKATRLPDALFAELATVDTPIGIMAIAALSRAKQRPDPSVDAVLLDGLQDPGNLGSILRTAAAAGFRQILLSSDCAQAWSSKTLRAAMGAHFSLDIHENIDLPDFLSAYRGQSIVTAPDAATDLFAAGLAHPGQPIAWIFGNEGQGVRPEVSTLAAERVRIPMPGNAESLNVGAAAAICLFETVRRRLG